MSDGSSESVGGVVGFWHRLETELDADHFLHLFLPGGAIAGQGLFDFIGGVFIDGEVFLFGDEQTNPARLGDRNTGGNIFAEEKFFDTDEVRLIFFDDFMKRVIDVFEAVGERGVGRSGNYAKIARDGAIGFSDFYNTKTADAGARIDAEDFHGTIISFYGALMQRTE